MTRVKWGEQDSSAADRAADNEPNSLSLSFPFHSLISPGWSWVHSTGPSIDLDETTKTIVGECVCVCVCALANDKIVGTAVHYSAAA